MNRGNAEEFTDALGQVFAGAVRLADIGAQLGIPGMLDLTTEEWAKRRLAGRVDLERVERKKVVAELTEQGFSAPVIADAAGVSEKTIDRDRKELGLTRDNVPVEPASNGDIVPGRDRTVLFTSDSPEWETPQDLFDQLDAEFGFELDVCATDENAKCGSYFTPADDGLKQEWWGNCWMNPPYGDTIGAWVAKAAAHASRGGTVVCLVPARVDTGWWWDYCRHGEIRFLRGRLRFGDGTGGAPFPSAVVILGRPAQVIWWER